jgi:phosphoglycerate dehydrogenase-like enzyme
MRVLRVAYTGDYLNAEGGSAYGDIGLGMLDGHPHIRYHFLKDQAPRPGDSGYWERLYSLEVRPEQIADVDALVVLRPRIQRSTLERVANHLTVIGRSGAGYDKIDVAACTENDVALFNAPLGLHHSTASAALLLMLALAKRLPQQERITREGRWDLQASVMGGELEGRTLGIIGLGHSGRELARLVAPFAMHIVAHSPHADAGQAAGLGVRLTSLEEVLRAADFVSLHCRLTDETRGMLGAAQLNLMKPSAYLVNIARGALVDQAVLVAALRERRIAGAGLDVFEVEPLPSNDPLLALDNVILTPHWLASTSEVWQATGRAMVNGLFRVARGEVPDHVINREVLDRPGFRAKLGRFVENRAALSE